MLLNALNVAADQFVFVLLLVIVFNEFWLHLLVILRMGFAALYYPFGYS